MKNSNPSILIVDDMDDDRVLIEKAFRYIGARGPIHTVNGGREAIAYLRGEGQFSDRTIYPYPSFILTDLKMPEGNGFAVLSHLKSNPEWVIIPTVVFSSSDDVDDIKQSYLGGASSYHVKPVAPDDLRRQVKVLYDYWMTCEVPQTDATGKRLTTDSRGKLGEQSSDL